MTRILLSLAFATVYDSRYTCQNNNYAIPGLYHDYHNGKYYKYYYGLSAKTARDAAQVCYEDGAFLAKFQTFEEFQYLKNRLGKDVL